MVCVHGQVVVADQPSQALATVVTSYGPPVLTSLSLSESAHASAVGVPVTVPTAVDTMVYVSGYNFGGSTSAPLALPLRVLWNGTR